jgi:hypothetical protein
LREAKQRLEAERAANPQAVPRSRRKRLREAKRRLEEELWSEVRANQAYEAYRARGRMKDGRRFGRPPDPYQPPATPEGRIKRQRPRLTRRQGPGGFLQGYNAQAVTNEHQVVLAAEIETVGADFGHLEPMLDATQRELAAAGIDALPEVLLADAGYWQTRCNASPSAASRFSSHPTPAAGAPRGATGTAAATTRCAKYWPASAAASSTASASR